eukprot:CAMPEP_0176326848 /NCGR_PEP_ID=MMETSP0121_2-20121125/74145_1 /TAXON_ID=160619 /ORGANISM="Kryptoperidinium foliaceum, Strain CCMP 1326" /LENGTH=67 /DNA_ID=CAMNT_0017669473 /DNA_START=86 /DNA_END=286 /DNA_ORIENTATION=+
MFGIKSRDVDAHTGVFVEPIAWCEAIAASYARLSCAWTASALWRSAATRHSSALSQGMQVPRSKTSG